MATHNDNVILFPKWKQTLETQSMDLMEQHQFAEALIKLNKLLDYGVCTYEIMISKLMCLIETQQYDEAQSLCESLLSNRDENYYHYMHIHLTILFQTSEYQQLMDEVEHAMDDPSLPEDVSEVFQQLYDMSERIFSEIQEEKSTVYMDEFQKAVTGNDYREQWIIVEKLYQLDIEPPEEMYTYLEDERIHPVVKTSIFQWMQKKRIKDNVDVRKGMQQITVQPNAVPSLEKDPIMKQIKLLLGEEQQKDPSLHHIMEKLLYRYLYVLYPIAPDEEDVHKVASAIHEAAVHYLFGENRYDSTGGAHPEVERYRQEIEENEKLYTSIIGDTV